MSGPCKISLLLLAIGVLALSAHAQEQKQRNDPKIRVQIGGPGENGRAGPHMGDWLRQFQGKSFDEQKRSLENDPDFKKLTPDKQEKLKERLQKFNELPPDKQKKILDRIDKFQHLTPQLRAQARAIWDRMRLLPEERRAAIRHQFHSLLGMSGDQRQRVMNSDQFNRQFNPDERDVIQHSLDLADQSGTEGTEPPK